MKTRSTLIIGCGYVGLPLALHLRGHGDDVDVWVHSAARAAVLAGYGFPKAIVGSVGDVLIWAQVAKKYDLIFHCASSGRGGVEAYGEVFLRGGDLLNRHQPQARRLFVSSTSVYGQTEGEIVTEESPANPTTETGKILVQAEAAALATGATIIRSSGIYGPGRSMLWEKFRRGDAVIEGDGSRWINQIHQQDLVAALAHLIEAGETGQIYNASDDTPVMQRDFYAWCSEILQRPLPPHGPVNLQRKRGFSNKRISNARLRATGWTPIYASFREGLTADRDNGEVVPGLP